MSVPEKRKSRNIRYSIQRHIGVNFRDANGLAGKVSMDDRLFDTSGKIEWVEVHFLNPMAGRRGVTLMQASICTLVGGKRSASDRYGDRLDELADMFHDAMHVREIPIYDFSVDPENPTLIEDAQIIVQNGEGKYREPESDQTFDPDDGINRRVLTYRFKTLSDFAGGSEFYD